MTSSTDHHEAWLAAHYALGKLEVKQGFTLTPSERSQFIRDYIQEHLGSKSLKDDSGKIES
jgi:hypothetical protein